MAWAVVGLLRGLELDKTSGVGTNDVESLNGLRPRAPEVNGANGSLGRFVPRIAAAGEHGELSRSAIFRNGIERGDVNASRGCGLSAQGIEQDGEAAEKGDDPDDASNDHGRKPFDKATPLWLRR